MKDQRKTEIKVGITVITALLIFLWILGWAKNFSMHPSNKVLMVKFENVSGLEIGDYVTINGVRKGFVEDMQIDADKVFVKLHLDSDVNLRKDAEFSVAMLDLMGGKKISVKPGISKQEIDYNKVHNGQFYADIPEVMAMVGTVQEDIVASLKQLRVTLTQTNALLNDEKLNANIKNSMKNLNEISSKMIVMMDENRSNIKKIASNTVDLTNEAKDFIGKNKDGIQRSVNELQNLLMKTDTLLTNANNFATEIKARQNNIGKILYDEEMYNNLNNSIKKLSELSNILLNQLKKEGVKVDAHISIF